MFSEADAAFCAVLLEILHIEKTHHLQTLIFFDKLFCDSSLFINGLSEKESHSIGRFYEMMLALALKWHDNQAVFNKVSLTFDKKSYSNNFLKECSSHPMRLKKNDNNEVRDSQIGFEEFRTICFKWHFRLCKTFAHMLNNGSYVSKRNTLIIMTKVLSAYPVVATHFASLLNAAEKLRDNEKGVRNDLSLLAASYATQLKKRHTLMVPLEDFYHVCFSFFPHPLLTPITYLERQT